MQVPIGCNSQIALESLSSWRFSIARAASLAEQLTQEHSLHGLCASVTEDRTELVVCGRNTQGFPHTVQHSLSKQLKFFNSSSSQHESRRVEKRGHECRFAAEPAPACLRYQVSVVVAVHVQCVCGGSV